MSTESLFSLQVYFNNHTTIVSGQYTMKECVALSKQICAEGLHFVNHDNIQVYLPPHKIDKIMFLARQ